MIPDSGTVLHNSGCGAKVWSYFVFLVDICLLPKGVNEIAHVLSVSIGIGNRALYAATSL